MYIFIWPTIIQVPIIHTKPCPRTQPPDNIMHDLTAQVANAERDLKLAAAGQTDMVRLTYTHTYIICIQLYTCAGLRARTRHL
jgi:hypothetical protein